MAKPVYFANRKQAQAFIEFIVSFFIFMAIVVFLFTAFFARNQPEAQKIMEQSSNLVVQSLAKLVFEDSGQNSSGSSDWETNCNVTLIDRMGLAQQLASPFIVPAKKLACLKRLNPQDITDKFGGIAGTRVRVPFKITTIPLIIGPSTCEVVYATWPQNFTGICNRLATGTVYFVYGIGNGSDVNRSATLKISVLFPLSVAYIAENAALEGDDSLIVENLTEGSLVKANTKVNNSDLDKFKISIVSPQDAAIIKEFSFKFSDGTNVGNFTLSNSTDITDIQLENAEEEETAEQQVAPVILPGRRVAEALRVIVVNSSDGTLHATVTRIRAAKRQITER